MASVSPTSGSSATDNQITDPTKQKAAADPLANESTFLTLLVQQMKNQDPSQPMDGTTFVTQLAQFSNLEQTLAVRQDMDTVTTKYAGTSSLDTSSNGTSSSGSTSNN